jgi:hypothetical protein
MYISSFCITILLHWIPNLQLWLFVWNSFRLLSICSTILRRPNLWIKSTFINTNVLCHCNGLAHCCVFYVKILQKHIGFVQPQLVSPCPQAIHNYKIHFFMSWLFFNKPLSFLLSYAMAIHLVCERHSP